MAKFWETEEDLTDAEQERLDLDTDFDADNPDDAASSIRAARNLAYSDPIDDIIEDRAEAIQNTNNDPDIPDKYEDDVFTSEQRAEQALRAVFQRGLGAAQGSRGVESAVQWGIARVDEFGGIVKEGEPDDSEYNQDNDLLPMGHPKRSLDDPPEGVDETPFVEGMPGDETKDELQPVFQQL